jgi:hypothetical protein
MHEAIHLVLSFSKISSFLKSEPECERYHVFREGSFLPVPDWRCLATQLGTPRGRYDEHNGKFPSVWNQGLIKPVGERNHFRRLMLADLATLQTICLWRLSGHSSAPAATWNLHTTQPKYFAPTSSEVVNLTGKRKKLLHQSLQNTSCMRV